MGSAHETTRPPLVRAFRPLLERRRIYLPPAATLLGVVIAAALSGSTAGTALGIGLIVTAVVVAVPVAPPAATLLSAAIGAVYLAAVLPAEDALGNFARVLATFLALAPLAALLRPVLRARLGGDAAGSAHARDPEVEHVLREAGALTDAAFSYAATLDRVAHLPLPLLADWAVLYEVPESGQPRRVALAAEGRAAEEALEHAFRSLPLRLNEQHPLGAVDDVLRNGQPRVFAQCGAHGLRAVGRDPGERLLLERLEPASLVMTPLYARGRMLGAMVFARTRGRQPYAEADLQLLTEYSRRAALAVENARLFDSAVSARAEAEGARERLVDILDGLATGFIALDTTGRVTHMNRAAERITGRTRAALLGASLWQEMPPHTAHTPIARFTTDAVQRQTAATRDFAVSWTEDLRWLEVNVAPSSDGASLYIRDVTERRAMASALQAKEEALRQSQKMEAVGRLAGGVAHDFNNLLMSIAGYAELLARKVDPADAMAQDIQEIVRATDRASSLTRQLLTYSRKQVHQPQRIDLVEVVGEMQRSLLRLLGEDIILVVNSEPELRPVFMDPSQVEQLLLNLAVNARDSMAHGGRLTITLGNTDIRDDNGTMGANRLAAGPYVAVEVMDTGTGIDASVLPHIFEPFFTTKADGKGTGLGLASAYGIVTQNRGAISVTSVVGRGSTFRVLFPAADARGQSPVAAITRTDERVAPAAKPRAEGVILVAEDESSVRRYVCEVLRGRGYTVLEASNGIEGIAVARRQEGEIDLLLTDVVMPELGGRALAEHITKQRPGTRVLFMSGYAEDEIAHHGVLTSGAQLLEKPFTSSLLLERVRALLALPPAPVRFGTTAA